MNHLEITRIGKGPDEGAVNILVPHDASYEQFQMEYPDILTDLLDAVTVDEETYRKFLTVEQDVFATEGAILLARDIVQAFQGNICVQVVKVMMPRGVLDMNRIESHALWNTFDHEVHSYLTKRLMAIYRSTSREIEKKVREAAMVIDIHTMSPTNPTKKVELGPETIEEFLKSWRTNLQSRRKIDIITQQTIGGETTSLGDREVIEAVSRKLQEGEIDHEKSGTYQLSNIHLGTKWAQIAKSYFNIDLTKDCGSELDVTHPDFDIAELKYDPKKLKRVMGFIAKGICEVLNQRLSDPKVLIH